jgi:hypothetical protein
MPSNTSPATAIVVTLPATVTVDLFDAIGTGLWYAFTPTSDADPCYVGARVLPNPPDEFAKLSAYKSLALLPISAFGAMEVDSFDPMQVPVSAGNTYYFKIISVIPPSGSVMATFTLIAPPSLPAAIGSIIVPDDGFPFPAVMIGRDSETVVRAFPYASGENGDILPAQITLMEAKDGTGGVQTVNLYDAEFNLLAEIEPPSGRSFGGDISADQVDTFYTISTDSPVTSLLLQGISNTGASTGSWTLPGTAFAQLSVAPAGTILYWSSAAVNGAIHRFDIPGNAALSDLVSGVATFNTHEIMTLADGSILVAYRKVPETSDFIRRYSAAGAALMDYAVGTYASGFIIDHMARDPGGAAAFWVWLQTASNDTSKFIKVDTAAGTRSETVTIHNFEHGLALFPEDTQDFGPSQSCPFFLLTAPVNEPVCATIVCPQGYGVVEKTIRRERITPHISNEQKNVFYPAIQVEVRPGTGHTIPPGVQPQVMLSVSFDGGYNWTPETWMSAGELGDYRKRVIARQLGYGRDVVFKVIVSDPNVWDLLGAYFDPPPIRGRH